MRLGAAVVIDDDNKVLGIITDGDLRRMLEKTSDFSQLTAKDIMTINPKAITADALATEALDTMKGNNISQLVVIQNKKYAGVIHLHDLIREGII
jgi:arabinose-5-phosphate isomerase